jgi:hypothetical protein
MVDSRSTLCYWIDLPSLFKLAKHKQTATRQRVAIQISILHYRNQADLWVVVKVLSWCPVPGTTFCRKSFLLLLTSQLIRTIYIIKEKEDELPFQTHRIQTIISTRLGPLSLVRRLEGEARCQLSLDKAPFASGS